MNCTPCKIAFEGVIELLLMLPQESLTPDARVKARQVAASLNVVELHIADQALRGIFDEPSQRDKVKEA